MFRNLFRILAIVALAGAAPRSGLAQTPPAPTVTPVPDPADPFFDDTVLRDIQLTINSKDWQSLKDHFLDNTYYPADFKWNGQVVRSIGIRSRGTGSRSAVKPGLRVDFNRYSTDQTFLGLTAVILRNNTQDPSGMRERLSMELFKRLGLKAQRETHVRLFINGVYSGLYTLCENYDPVYLQKQFSTDSTGHLYEYAFDNAAATPFTFNYLGSDASLYTPAPFKPETLELDPQGQVLERLFWTINVAGDAVWRSSMAEFLDLKAFIRHLALENFLGEEDGLTGDYGPNNFYFYRLTNGSLFTFLPWDKSNTFWAAPDYSISHNITDGSPTIQNRLVLRALNDPELRDLWEATLLECADSIMKAPVSSATPPVPLSTLGWLEYEVGRMADQTRAADYSDPAREVYTNTDFDESIRFLTTWAQTRSDIVRAQVAADRASRGIK